MTATKASAISITQTGPDILQAQMHMACRQKGRQGFSTFYFYVSIHLKIDIRIYF